MWLASEIGRERQHTKCVLVYRAITTVLTSQLIPLLALTLLARARF